MVSFPSFLLVKHDTIFVFDIQLCKFEYTYVYSKLPYSRPRIFEFQGTNIEYTIWKNSHIRYLGSE